MLCGDDPELQKFAVKKLLKVQNGSKCSDVSVRVFLPLQLNFNADCLCFLVDWKNITITESILMWQLSLDEISNLVEKVGMPTLSCIYSGCVAAYSRSH